MHVLTDITTYTFNFTYTKFMFCNDLLDISGSTEDKTSDVHLLINFGVDHVSRITFPSYLLKL